MFGCADNAILYVDCTEDESVAAYLYHLDLFSQLQTDRLPLVHVEVDGVLSGAPGRRLTLVDHGDGDPVLLGAGGGGHHPGRGRRVPSLPGLVVTTGLPRVAGVVGHLSKNIEVKL